VGYALRVAPARLKLPWHRIVNASHRSAFAVGSANYSRQRRLLAAEGVALVDGRIRVSAPERDLDALLWGARL
jgi:methylated-DNA-protein-cysteine methyltransferase-like protein